MHQSANLESNEAAGSSRQQEQGVSWSVETDAAWQSPYGPAKDSVAHARFSAVVTLSLAVLGSSVLPLPYAISKVGVAAGCLTMLVVAWANNATSHMLIQAAAYSGKGRYESLAEWAGGRVWKVITQVSLILLLFGTMCGGIALLSTVGREAVQAAMDLKEDEGASDEEREATAAALGRLSMFAVVVLVMWPLSLQRHMRQLEKAATAGVVMVGVLAVLLVWRAAAKGFPALHNGELPIWRIQVGNATPEAFALLGYAFYMQPMMMPLLQEMPAGPVGVRIMKQATSITLYVVAVGVYGTVGLAGASLFGAETKGNIMGNTIIDGRWPKAALYCGMLLYLAVCMTTTQFALRYSIDELFVGPDAPYTFPRAAAETTVSLAAELAVAMTFPKESEKIFAVTGASVVAVVCYVVPVFIQLRMYQRQRLAGKGSQQGLSEPLLVSDPAVPELSALQPASPPRQLTRWQQGRELASEVVLPLVVLVLGVGLSVAALLVAMQTILP